MIYEVPQHVKKFLQKLDQNTLERYFSHLNLEDKEEVKQ